MNQVFLTHQKEIKMADDKDGIEIFESVVVKKDDVSVSITGNPDGILAGRTGEQIMMYCSDILRKASGEGSFEESLQVQSAIEQTLKVNYGWGDIEFNEFIRIWRRNLYLLKIGQDNHTKVDLKEFQNFMTYIDHKKKVEAGESQDVGAQSADELQRFAEQAIADQEANDISATISVDGQAISVEEILSKGKKKK
jgi:hypothetical protein